MLATKAIGLGVTALINILYSFPLSFLSTLSGLISKVDSREVVPVEWEGNEAPEPTVQEGFGVLVGERDRDWSKSGLLASTWIMKRLKSVQADSEM